MLTKRECVIAVAAATVTAVCCFAAEGERPILPCSVYDWQEMKAEPTAVGEKRLVFSSRTATLDQLSCHISTIGAGKEPHPPHKHIDEEIVIVKEGTIEAMQNGEKTIVGPGSIIYEKSNELHGLKNVGDTPASYFVIKIWPPGTLPEKK